MGVDIHVLVDDPKVDRSTITEAHTRVSAQAFKLINKSGDGVIKHHEFVEAFTQPRVAEQIFNVTGHQIHADFTEQQVDWLFDQADVDGSGTVELNEFERLWEDLNGISLDPSAYSRPANYKPRSSSLNFRRLSLMPNASQVLASVKSVAFASGRSKLVREAGKSTEVGSPEHMIGGKRRKSVIDRLVSRLGPAPRPHRGLWDTEEEEKPTHPEDEAWALMPSAKFDEQEVEPFRTKQMTFVKETNSLVGFPVYLGRLLAAKVKSGYTVDGLMADWDRNGNGSIEKMEFRLLVKKMVSQHDRVYKVDVNDIDALFVSFDLQAGGGALVARRDAGAEELDLREVKSAMSNLMRRASKATKLKLEAEAEVARWGEMVEQGEGAVKVTVEYERAKAELQELEAEKPNLQSRLGKALETKRVNVNELGCFRDERATAARSIDLREFHQTVVQFVPNAKLPDTTKLFDSLANLDGTKQGPLSVKELQTFLLETQDYSKQRIDRMRELKVKVKQLRPQAEGLQAAVHTLWKEEESREMLLAAAVLEKKQRKEEAEAQMDAMKLAAADQKLALAEQKGLATVSKRQAGLKEPLVVPQHARTEKQKMKKAMATATASV